MVVTKSFLNGSVLDAACNLAMSRILSCIDAKASTDLFEDVNFAVEGFGYVDGCEGESKVPSYFKDEPFLVRAYELGNDVGLTYWEHSICGACAHDGIHFCADHK